MAGRALLGNLVKSDILILFLIINSGKKVGFYMQPELNKIYLFFCQHYNPLRPSSISCAHSFKLNCN